MLQLGSFRPVRALTLAPVNKRNPDSRDNDVVGDGQTYRRTAQPVISELSESEVLSHPGPPCYLPSSSHLPNLPIIIQHMQNVAGSLITHKT
ncbi:hypothetical protein J6590_011293 [Homalodisca vitripennis]|nr:hypothetical protein J6590_011293 [Homalodisca vitripennis]